MHHHLHAGHALGDLVLSTLLLTGSLLALLLYAAALLHLWRRRVRISVGRAVSFALGILLLLLAASPTMATWAAADLRGHMTQHLLLGMIAPVGLVLGAPGTLLLRVASPPLRRALVALLGARPLRVLLHPSTAALLDVGGMYLLYLTPLYLWSMATPLGHVAVHLHFLAAGCLFSWAIAGPDPAPHRPGPTTRLLALFGAMAAHAVLGKLMYAYGFPRGTGADLAELEAAARLMYYGGDLAELLLAAALFLGPGPARRALLGRSARAGGRPIFSRRRVTA